MVPAQIATGGASEVSVLTVSIIRLENERTNEGKQAKEADRQILTEHYPFRYCECEHSTCCPPPGLYPLSLSL